MKKITKDDFAEICVVFGIGIQTGNINRDGAANLIKKIEEFVE